jgi:N-acetylneuraminic acid mutarotase
VPVVEKNIIYVMGGQDINGDVLPTVESYNPATNIWTEEAPMLLAKTQFQAGLVGTTIVAPDGLTSASANTGDNEGYAAATDTWTSKTADPTARAGTCDGAVGAELYVAGGYSTGTITLTESFKLSKNKWTTLAAMPQATLLPASVVFKKQLYCIGGITTYEGTLLGNVQIYQP